MDFIFKEFKITDLISLVFQNKFESNKAVYNLSEFQARTGLTLCKTVLEGIFCNMTDCSFDAEQRKIRHKKTLFIV